MTEYTKELIKMVKASGQEVIDRAESIVGDNELISDFYITLKYPQDSIPEIEITKSLISKKAFDVLVMDKGQSEADCDA